MSVDFLWNFQSALFAGPAVFGLVLFLGFQSAVDRTRVRLHGIEAPERDQPYGPGATAALEYMVEKSVYIVEVDTHRYGRMVGQLYHSKEGYDINASMVCAGFAWWYERYAPDSEVLEDCQEDHLYRRQAFAALRALGREPFSRKHHISFTKGTRLRDIF